MPCPPPAWHCYLVSQGRWFSSHCPVRTSGLTRQWGQSSGSSIRTASSCPRSKFLAAPSAKRRDRLGLLEPRFCTGGSEKPKVCPRMDTNFHPCHSSSQYWAPQGCGGGVLEKMQVQLRGWAVEVRSWLLLSCRVSWPLLASAILWLWVDCSAVPQRRKNASDARLTLGDSFVFLFP